MKTKFLIPFACAAILGFTSCDSNDSDNGNAKVNISLTDAPGDYAEVNVDIIGVEIHTDVNAADNSSGWQTLSMVKTGVINLLDLSNGKSVLLSSADLPAGKISQIRLKLGSNNTLKLKTGQVVNLTTPSGQTSGLKLKINQELKADVTYEILLDFDAAKSIVPRGNTGQYNLKPVIRTITQAVAGGIRGMVMPAAAKPGILAISATNDTVSAFSDASGLYLIRGLQAGTYRVEFTAPSPYKNKTETVTVTKDAITDMGMIHLD